MSIDVIRSSRTSGRPTSPSGYIVVRIIILIVIGKLSVTFIGFPTNRAGNTYVLEPVLLVIVILKRLKVVVVVVEALELQCTACKPIDCARNDLKR